MPKMANGTEEIAKEGNIESEKNNLRFYPHTDTTIFLRSCEEEIIIPLEGNKTGEIPKWLQGTLIRNGPGSLKVGNYQFKHLFDGSALLHRYEIKNGDVTYQCRFLKSETYKKNWEARRIVFTEFGTESVPDPCSTILKKIAVIFSPKQTLTDNANISIYPLGDEIYSFAENIYAHKVNRMTLETEERKDISNFIPMVVHHSSHPHVTSDGTVYNLALAMSLLGPVHHIVRFVEPDKKDNKSMFDTAHVVASVPAKWPLHPSYMHTFGITDNYFILIQQPFSISLLGNVKALIQNQPTSTALKWFGEEKTIISIIERKTGKVKNFYTKPFFYLHTINQYEEGDDYLVLDICCFNDPSFVDCMFTERLENAQRDPNFAKMAKNHPLRFIIPLEKRIKDWQQEKANFTTNLIDLPYSTAKAYCKSTEYITLEPQELCILSCETPQIYYKKYCGKPYRYFYAIGADIDTEHPGLIIKVDTHEKSFKTWYKDNCYPSEPIFSPKPDSKEEDDGVLLSSLIWGREETHKIGLVILDAVTLVELGRVEFNTPSPTAKCLHGWFFPEHHLKKDE